MLTTFLAGLWGPTLLALGIGFLLSPKYYKKLYFDLDKNSLSLLILSMLLIPLGILQVATHNIWETFTEGFISFLGWATLIKGITIAIFPRFVDRAGDYEAKKNMVPYAGLVMVIVGMYLSSVAFF